MFYLVNDQRYQIPSGKNLTDEEKFKWREILAFMKQNPEILLDLMPDNVNINFRDNDKTQHRKGHSMIPELGVVPPQSHLGSNKIGAEDDSMISYRKKQSFGESKFSSDSYQKTSIFDISNKLKKNEDMIVKPHNNPHSSNRFLPSNLNRKPFKPNTANKIVDNNQTPSFLASNILSTVNKTVYKVCYL